MIENNRSIRIRTKVGNDDADKYVSVKLDSDVNIIELLSLKIDTSNFYKMHTSNYGCIAGRVLANGGVGIPNAKISVFVSLDDKETADPIISALYPYSYVYGKDNEGRRYNLLPEEQVTSCHTPVGTFPSKRMVLDDDNYVEIFDKYYKYTTRSNDAGDYMIFGVPVGENIVHVDIDLSDIGMLSQRPRDMIYKGYNITQFENANKFKSDTNLDNLTQIISQNDSVYVYPFWGDTEEDEIKITRNDVDVQYKFEPTCIFLGSLITDERSQGISKKCIPSDRMGKMDRLTTGAGTIEMIRKTPDGNVEEKQIQGNQLIDGNGTWCYQIPMNLDYYMTDEYGNFVPSDDKEKGIPTRTRVRFRISLTDFQSDYENNHLAKLLVPNNPKNYEDLKNNYSFGSDATDDEVGSKSYRDLFWNKIYTVKQYIPRIQKGNNNRNVKFSGIKNINVNGGNNPIPYNNMRVNLTFMFALQCTILKILVRILGFVNSLNETLGKISSKKNYVCACMGDGICPDLENWYFAPRCKHLKETLESLKDEDNDTNSIDYQNREYVPRQNYCITKKTNYLMQCIEINLAMEYEVIQFDFYNDWINGMLYVPHWYINYRKKRSYLFGLIRRKARLEACMEDTFGTGRRYTQQCALYYGKDENKNYSKVTSPKGCKNDSKQKCHKGYGRKSAWIFSGTKGGGGLVHSETTLQNQKVYYFKPCEWLNVNNNSFGSRCILWATDIVLLGSLNECDEDGIPRIFEELTSSTFVMPSNLASTNMDNQLFMYGNAISGAYCIGENTLMGDEYPLQKLPQTFETYNEWIKNSDDAKDSFDDVTEYPVTEAAGIDWGYNGPNQGDNNWDDLYYPGGHFLGISCLNSQVNIKSCVNLSRICEFGAMMSQRQSFVRKDGNDFKYDYLAPNGYISKLEITDANFRRVFASLNYNGLKTKVDKDTLYRKYDLKYIHPTNFNGELSDKINDKNKSYNKKVKDDSTEQKDPNTLLYYKALEASSSDYYYFRMGLSDYEDLSGAELDRAKRNKFLVSSSGSYALPQYENSFYFYFGLNDGNTAIDRFFKDFYAPCNTEDEDAKYFKLEINDKGNNCVESNASVDITIIDLESPFNVRLSKIEGGVEHRLYLTLNKDNINVSRTSDGGYEESITHNYSVFHFVNMPSGTYKLTMVALTSDMYAEGLFVIGTTISNQIGGITVNHTNFSSVSYDEDANYLEREPKATITVSNVYDGTIYGILVATDEKYVFKATDVFGIESFVNDFKPYVDVTVLKELDAKKVVIGINEDDSKNYVVPVWKGNDTYHTYIIHQCWGSTRIVQLADSIPIMNDGKPDVYFSDTDLTVRMVNAGNNLDWVNNAFKMASAYKWRITDQKYAYITTGTGGDGNPFIAVGGMHNGEPVDDSAISLAANTLNEVAYANKYDQMCSIIHEDEDGKYIEMPDYSYFYNEDSKYSEKQRWLLKQCLFYKSTMFSSAALGSIKYTAMNDDTNTKIKIYGNAETAKIEDIGDNDYRLIKYVSSVQSTANNPNPSNYRMDVSSFLFPTSYFKGNSLVNYTENGYNKEYWDNINKYGGVIMPSNVKDLYRLHIDGYGDVKIPSIYRPCYINAVMLVNEEDEKRIYAAAVTNLITYNNAASSVKFNNGTTYKDGYMATFMETFNGDYTQVKVLPETITYDTKYGNGDESYTFTVTEGKPNGYSGDIKPIVYSVSSECHFPCNESDDDFYYTDGMRFYYCAKTENKVKVDDTTINEGAEDVKLVKGTTIKVSNVTKDSIVDVYLRGSNDGQAYVIHSFSTLNLLTDTIYTVNGYYYDAEGKTVMDTVTFDNDSETGIKRVRNGYKCTVIDANGWDKLLITSNVEYNIFAVNPDGVIRNEQVNIVPSTDSNGKKTGSREYTPKTNGKIVIWWVDTDVEENSVFKIDYTSNGKFNCGITDNRSISLFSAKIVEDKTYYPDYVIVNNSVILGCKINGEQNKVKTNSDKDTYNYVNKISGAMIPKDYSNTHTAFYNGIFGNAEYNVIEVTEKFTLAHIASVAKSKKCTKWEAFKYIVKNELAHSIFAVYDDWTKLEYNDEVKEYSKDVKDIWNYLYPDTNRISMVKYYPKDI